MYSNHQKLSSREVVELRKEAGHWLKELRETKGFSQRQLAEKVGGDYYTFISQLEAGRGRIPPDRYAVWAKALGINPRLFVQRLLRYYDPATYAILFGHSEGSEAEGACPQDPTAGEHATHANLALSDDGGAEPNVGAKQQDRKRPREYFERIGRLGTPPRPRKL
jgi:transcriptional regulator with XRE-family HTH domain